MPSQAMQDAIDPLRERRKDSAGQPRRRWNSAVPPSPRGTGFIRSLTMCW